MLSLDMTHTGLLELKRALLDLWHCLYVSVVSLHSSAGHDGGTGDTGWAAAVTSEQPDVDPGPARPPGGHGAPESPPPLRGRETLQGPLPGTLWWMWGDLPLGASSGGAAAMATSSCPHTPAWRVTGRGCPVTPWAG